MKNQFLKFKQKYYRNINHMMNRLNLEIDKKLDDDEENIQDNNKKEIKKCQICNENEFKYICPKCKIFYCSLNCYKKHNKNCTEEFYKNNVIEELKSTKVNEDEGKKFRYILKSYYDNINKSIGDSILDFNDNEIENKKRERYEKILLKIENGTFDEYKDFTPDDWKDFKKFLNSANDEKIGKLYKPFWLRNIGSLEIIDINEFNNINESDKLILLNLNLNLYKEYFHNNNNDFDNEEEEIEDFNSIKLNGKEIEINEEIINKSLIIKYQNVQILKKLTSINPNSKNIYQLIIILCTIIYIFRLFNGDFEGTNNEDDIDILEYIFYICPLLYDKNQIIDNSLEKNLKKFFEKIEKIEKDMIKKTKKLIYRDLKSILIGYKFFIFEGLIRLYDIIHFYSLKLCLTKELKLKCSNSKYKLIYFMSFLKSNISNETLDKILNNINQINF